MEQDLYTIKYETDSLQGRKRVALEDSIMHKGYPVAAGSRILEGFVSPLSATVIKKLEAAGMAVSGKLKMDEFGAAGLFAVPGTNGSCGDSVTPGGDTGGDTTVFLSSDADSVLPPDADLALFNDYTGAVSLRAAACGLYYIHPTYGTVSRYGLIPAVPSMDQIGIACRKPEDGFALLNLIAGYDERDGAMIYDKNGRKTDKNGSETYMNGRKTDMNGSRGAFQSENTGKPRLRIATPTNLPDCGGGHKQASAIGFIISGVKTESVEIELIHVDIYTQLMQILCSAELSNNISRYDGVKFGYRAAGFKDLKEFYTKTRTEALGLNAKLAVMLGAMVLSQGKYERVYDKAMRIRRLIKESLDFSKYDVIAIPLITKAFPEPGDESDANPGKPADAPDILTDAKRGAPDANPADDAGTSGATADMLSQQSALTLSLTALPRLCGLPAITVPCAAGAIMFVADRQREDILRLF